MTRYSANMRTIGWTAACAAIVAVGAAVAPALAFGVAPALARPSARAAAVTEVGVHHDAKLGNILVDAQGHTLYLSTADGRDRSACSSTCGRTWKPLAATGRLLAVHGSGVSQALLGSIRLSGGRRQVTYAHHPLYLYAKDASAGVLHGEGAKMFGATWYVVNVKGAAVKPKHASGGGSGPCNPLCSGY